jgi:hypothetical protein
VEVDEVIIIDSDHDDLDIRSTDFEVFEVRTIQDGGKPMLVVSPSGSKKTYAYVGDVIKATVKTANPSASVKKPGKN